MEATNAFRQAPLGSRGYKYGLLGHHGSAKEASLFSKTPAILFMILIDQLDCHCWHCDLWVSAASRLISFSSSLMRRAALSLGLLRMVAEPSTAILYSMAISVILPNTTVVEAQQHLGYSAAWTVPFAACAYFEKMQCDGHREELVRVIINDRVLPLTQCGGDSLGHCTLSAWIDSLAFAQMDGDWDQCFV